ncbi:MAG: hypothetical protein M3436_03025 [Pseudomonadota bacterium]|nr:hypothetical protein [Pseudomonadota bacterium]
MEIKKQKRNWRDVLVQDTFKKRNQATIRRYYEAFRREQDWPDRCDNRDCQFHSGPLEWNGKPFSPILDHRYGYHCDNTPGSLRFLCPICDSQNTETRGGANKNRIRDVIGTGYTARNRDGTSDILREGISGGESSGVGVALKSE